MPLGDSLTFGETLTSTQGGYRNLLYSLLDDDGFNVDFVGTFEDDSNPGLPDVDHQGLEGARLDEIQDNLGGWLDAVDDPDVVLLLAGTNDFWQDSPLAVVESRMENLITEIAKRRPFAKIIVSTLPPRFDDATIEANQHAFNEDLPGIVSQQVALGRQVTLVKMHQALTETSDFSADGVHPSTAGYAKMAEAWHKAITDPVDGVITPQGTSNPPVIARIGVLEDDTHVSVMFSKPVADDAVTLTNFNISGGISISSAALDPVAKRTVTLTTTPQAPGTDYTLSVSGVRDRTAGQTLIAPESMAAFARDSMTNGGFEEDYATWTATGNSEIQTDGLYGYEASEGNKLISFNSGDEDPGGSLSQTFATTAGKTYRLVFDYGIASDENHTPQELAVSVQGTSTLVTDTLAIQRQGNVHIRWLTESYDFIADSTTATVTFTDQSTIANSIGIDLLLDKVRVVPLEIPTLAVTSSAFSGVPMTVSENDIASNGNGTTGLIRFYSEGTTVTVTAPAVSSGKDFLNWRKNGVDLPDTGNEISLTVDSVVALDAVYEAGSENPLTAYEQWLDGFGLTGTPGGDSDGDSIPDAIEYVIGGNPANHPDENLLPTVARVNDDPDNDSTPSDYLLFSFRRTDEALADPDTAIAAEWATSPAGPWLDAGETPGVETIEDDAPSETGVKIVHVFLPESLASKGRLFARLRVAVAPP